VPEHVRKFLDAGVRAMSVRGVPTRTSVRRGAPAPEILAEIREGNHDLLVMGAPVGVEPDDDEPFGSVIGKLIRIRPPCPILIVRAADF
jgi:nucleotide-binding universal stress UspA family protein